MKLFLLCLLFPLVVEASGPAPFGDIPANLSIGVGQSVRRNAAGTLFEAYTPGSGGGTWGSITGTLSDQTDLQSALDAKVGVLRSVSTTAPISGGGNLSSNLTLSMHVADATHDGYLSSSDWSTFNAGGGGTPGGSNTQAQYNNSGVFGGIPSITYDGSTTFLVSPVISGDAIQGVVLNNAGGYGSLVAQSTAINTGLSWAFVPHDTAPSVRPTNIGLYSAPDTGNSNLLSISSKGTGDNYNLIASYAMGTATIAPIGIEANSSLGTTPQLVIGTDGGVSIGTGTAAGSTNLKVAGTVTASNLSGTNTGDQTITLTGNVTGSGTGSFATTLASIPVVAGTNLTGTAASFTAGHVTTNANLTGDVTSVGNATTLASIPAISGANLTGTATSLTAGNVTSWTLAEGPSTTASALLGRTSAGAGIPQEITLGTNLSMSGQTLNATGGGASVANPGSQVLGLTAINGSASTAMRSDGAPALDVSIAPTWTGLHTWKYAGDSVTNTATNILTIGHNSSGTPTTSYGTRLLLQGKSSTTNDRDMGALTARWSTATDGSRASNVEVEAVSSTTTGKVATFGGAGSFAVGGFAAIPNADGVANFGTGFRIAGAAAAGSIPIGNGTNFTGSSITYPSSATIGNVPYATGAFAYTDTDIGAWTIVKITGSDATTTGQAFTSFLTTNTLTATTLYEFEAVLLCTTSAVTTGTQYAITGNGTGTAATVFATVSGNSSAANTAQTIAYNTIASANGATWLTYSSGQGTIIMKGFFTSNSTGTLTVSLQHLKVTSGTSTVKIGSIFKYRKA
jgi:hypothetical protein